MRGVVTLLFTDIVGSTRLWAEHEDLMSVQLARHDALVTEAIARADGRVFKHTGDGLAAVFVDPVQAVQAGADIQRLMGAEQWLVPAGVHVRIGVHSGAVHEREGDLFGPTVNRSARLMGRCPADGVLVSEVTASLIAGLLPDGLSLDDLGRVQLRDLAQSELVYAIRAHHLPAIDPRAVASTIETQRTGWLPQVEHELIGRDHDLGAVVSHVRSNRLVSIVGAGGMGKTRLAVAVAVAVADDFGDGVWWCDLTVATHENGVAVAVMAGLSARPQQGKVDNGSVVNHLGQRSALLILDNCEHVLGAIGDLVEMILRLCPGISLVATTQQALGVRGENVVTISSLPPDESGRLFLARARQVRPDLPWDEPTALRVKQICEQLDGIPLAVELAAARCRSMSVAEIGVRLDDRFKLLRGGRAHSERHRTLHAAVDWSYSLLDEHERAVFDRLAVFSGGATLDAVAGVTGLDEYDALELLDRLASRSIVVVDDTPLGTRYRLLATMHEFARQRLVDQDLLESAHAAHLDWAVGLADCIGRSLTTSDEAVWFRRYIAEIDNFRAAVRYAVSINRHEQWQQLMSGIMLCAIARPSHEVLDWIDESLLDSLRPTHFGTTLTGQLGEFALFAGDTQRASRLLTKVDHSRRTNPAAARAIAQHALWVNGDVELAEDLLRTVTVTTPADEFLRSFYLMNVDNARWSLAPTPREAAFDRNVLDHGNSVVARCRRNNGQISLAASLAVMSYLHVDRLEFSAAAACATEAASIAQDLGAWFLVDLAQIGMASSLSQLAALGTAGRIEAVEKVRDILVDALAHRNYFFVGNLLADDVAKTLWLVDDRPSAVLVRAVGTRSYATGIDQLQFDDANDAAFEMTAAAELQASELTLHEAGFIAVHALQRWLDRVQ